MLALPLALAACSPASHPTVTTLSGTVVQGAAAAWTGGAGQVLASTAFNVTDLPHNVSCSGKPIHSDASARAVSLQLRVSAAKSGMLGNSLAADNNAQVGAVIYLDRPLNVSGSVTCQTSNITNTTTFDLKLGKGWNLVTLDANAATHTITMTSGRLPSKQWMYISN